MSGGWPHSGSPLRSHRADGAASVKIAAALIVGPGESHRHLDRTLRLVSRWADTIVAYADGADRDTIAALKHAKAHYALGAGPVFPRDESEVRNRLLAHVDRTLDGGHLVVVIDADEELTATSGTVRSALLALAREHADAWSIVFHHLWAPDGSLIRVDGGWAPHPQVRVYRHLKGDRVPQKALACAPVPTRDLVALAERLVMLHHGYARHDDRLAKYARYTAIDGGRYHAASHIHSIVDPEPQLVATP